MSDFDNVFIMNSSRISVLDIYEVGVWSHDDGHKETAVIYWDRAGGNYMRCNSDALYQRVTMYHQDF